MKLSGGRYGNYRSAGDARIGSRAEQSKVGWQDKLLDYIKIVTRVMLLSQIAYRNEVPLKDALPNVRRLNEEQCAFVYTDSALDFGVYDVVTKKLVLAIEVDGWHFHGYSDEQQKRDALKDSIMAAYGIPVLRLLTNGSGEEQLIREALNSVLV